MREGEEKEGQGKEGKPFKINYGILNLAQDN
jgi:hypothetical protein